MIKGTVNASNISTACANGSRIFGPDKRIQVAEVGEDFVEFESILDDDGIATETGADLENIEKMLRKFGGKRVKVLVWAVEG